MTGLNGLRLPSLAQYFAQVRSEAELAEGIARARTRGLAINLLGSGSNVLLPAKLPGVTLQIDIPGIEVNADTVIAAGGENWHGLVMKSLDAGLSGLENLSLIPGTVGAAPVQNIGAYGVELSEFVRSVRAIDTRTSETIVFTGAECRFGYRHSLFRMNGHFAITAVELRLESTFVPRLEYSGLVEELAGDAPSAIAISLAVCRLRRRKLPDPAVEPNVGSFFKNPVVSVDQFHAIQAQHPGLTSVKWSDGSVKLSAAQMIDQLGFKGVGQGGAAISGRHALVVVNSGHATLDDVLGLASSVQQAVWNAYGVELEIEPVSLPLRS